MQKRLYPHWEETVVFSTEGPQPQTLFETENSRAVIAGLEAGQKIPPHAEGLAIFHLLEGTGQMIVDEEQFAVQTGATVVVPDGARRGIEAETRLAFLAVRVASSDTQAQAKNTIWKPPMKFGLMIMFVLMMGMMIVMAMTSSGSGGWGSGVWAMIVFPFFGLLIMLIMMFFFFRRMSSSGGPMSRMMGHSHAMPSQGKENTLTYNIPAVNCMHCKMTIEREVGELSGVDSVSVDVETKQAVIKFDPPSTKAEIEALLTKIGYPPESQ